MTEIKNLMTKEIIKIKAHTTIQNAYNEMHLQGIRHLPVVDTMGKLIGIISDRDIQSAMTFNPDDTVENFMSWPVEVIDENTSVEEVTRKMIQLKVSALAVTGPGLYIKGIITTDDLLKYLLELLGTSEVSRTLPLTQLKWRNF